MRVGVKVGVSPGCVSVDVGVEVLVGVDVGVGVLVKVSVGVAVGASSNVTYKLHRPEFSAHPVAVPGTSELGNGPCGQ